MLTAMFSLGLGAYIVLPLVLQRHLCPPMTFKSGHMGSVLWQVAGLLLIIVSFMIPLVRWCSILPDAEPPQKPGPIRALQKDKIVYLLVVLSGLLVSAAMWWNSLESYYCITSEKILLHPSALADSRVLTWADVRLVRAECGSLKGGYLWGSIVLSLPDEMEVNLPINTRYEYESARTALAGRHYRYQISSSVTKNLCPPALYPLLVNWGK
jgi:hypothetical protein